ncbi:Gamma-glutamyl cyclotransferase, AIG2-like [Roseovarius marisflavi]|uniref:Gamma-glutamyl cyclotransferase, AIG2-like n=1 Tax=Roseovarius marisflavi TaxID=1054996 RepID=A0A1M7DTL7_9RHOB|nr:gamma-glutamylcyclotransferase family protein [Roseovarius marisflavi]SHL82519.1 Gamma-glutamyl cyclotransferase, AIG2-like [Roseovarius marisflavi]
MKNRVWVFFYGSNIDLNVLKKVGFEPDEVHIAKLKGFDIQISPLANLVRSDRHCTYGILVTGTHEELERLYGLYVQKELGATYLPEAVLCEKEDGSLVPALCYIAPETPPSPATPEYLARILMPARAFGFPDWCVERLEDFAASS